MSNLTIFVGWDSNEAIAADVLMYTIDKYKSRPVDFFLLKQQELRDKGLYTRELDKKASNEFSMTRWLTPYLNRQLFPNNRYALFLDCDFVFTGDIYRIFDYKEDASINVVKHEYVPKSTTKMKDSSGKVQAQKNYPRKNWSSFVLYDCENPIVHKLTLEVVNSESPMVLHRFMLFDDKDVGGFNYWTKVDGQKIPLLNHLAGEYKQPTELPLSIHLTLGIPTIHTAVESAYSKEWLDYYHEMKLHERIQKLENSIKTMWPL